MFKIQYRLPGAGLWNLAALPTSLQTALGQARSATTLQQAESVRIVPGVGMSQLPNVDIKV